ncbi:MAG: tetratricopeptide repeat protein [Candidatus Sumerlaeaceae bacterium]|nr:tetratricopeptide repeat protein [Candidatus Sumerlaeaceae bacterium]
MPPSQQKRPGRQQAQQSGNPTGQTAKAGATATAPAPSTDPLRSLLPQDRDIIPIPVLIGIFAFVAALIWYNQGPEFLRNFAVYRSGALANKGDYQGAIYYLRQRVQNSPTDPSALGELGNALFRVGSYDESLKYFNEAQANRNNVRQDEDGKTPPPPDYSSALAEVAFKKAMATPEGKPRDFSETEKYLADALKVNRLDKLANYTYGEVEFARGNYRKAVEYFKIVAKAPGYKERVQDYYKKIDQAFFKDIQ